jgi:hypothetical protein
MQTLYVPEPSALGDAIMILSMIYSFDDNITMVVQAGSFYTKLKNIFNLDDHVLIIEEQNREKFQFLLDSAPHPRNISSIKIFSRYIKCNSLNLWNNTFDINPKHKKCVAICINDGQFIKNQNYFDACENSKLDLQWPFSKFIDKETYNYINFLTLETGYDTLIIDHRDISLEHKVFVLNELCDFVITYEGGLAHLAHCLDIPVIMLPWKSIEKNIKKESWHHLDQKTYFIRDCSEILSWTPTTLKEIIAKLHNNNGNNFWLEDKNYNNISPLMDYLNETSIGNDRFFTQLSWIQDNIKNPTLGGFKN